MHELLHALIIANALSKIGIEIFTCLKEPY